MVKCRWLLWVLVLSLMGCARGGVRVETALNQEVKFENLRSFSLMLPNSAIPVPGEISAFKMLRMRQLTYGRLIARGFRAEDQSKAGFLVSVHAGRPKEAGTNDTRDLKGAGYPSTVRPYHEGRFVIEFLDPKSKRVVWHGRGASVNSDTSDERLAKIIEAILSRYPPAPSAQ